MIISFFKSGIKTITPLYWHKKLSYVYNLIKYFGFSRKCPVCSSYLRVFLQHGVIERKDAVCPVCRVKEHHRLAWLYFKRQTNIFSGGLTMLHLAPEETIGKRFRQIPNLNYISGDLFHDSDVKMNAADLPIKDGCIDVIYCAHVLNMMPPGKDVIAIREFYRVMSKVGWALIQVPINGEKTLECKSPCSRRKRLEMFGDPDMFRIYGKDFKKRLELSGFDVAENNFYKMLVEKDRLRFGLKKEKLYICRKYISN